MGGRVIRFEGKMRHKNSGMREIQTDSQTLRPIDRQRQRYNHLLIRQYKVKRKKERCTDIEIERRVERKRVCSSFFLD